MFIQYRKEHYFMLTVIYSHVLMMSQKSDMELSLMELVQLNEQCHRNNLDFIPSLIFSSYMTMVNFLILGELQFLLSISKWI